MTPRIYKMICANGKEKYVASYGATKLSMCHNAVYDRRTMFIGHVISWNDIDIIYCFYKKPKKPKYRL